jgi:transcriptional regulator of PTS gene
MMPTLRSRDAHALELVYRSGSMSRSDLGDKLGLNQTAVIRLVGQLIDDGLLTTEAKESKQRGRPKEQIKVSPHSRYSLGLEFGREHLILVLINALAKVEQHHIVKKPPRFEASTKTLERLIGHIQDFLELHHISSNKVVALGLALHDIVNAQSDWFVRDHFNSGSLNVVKAIKERWPLTVIAEDVSRSFAFAEQRFGSAQQKQDVLYVFLGKDGVGGGIFLNGELLKSSSGICGELGHLVVEPEGLQCHCGSRGCLETVASHQAVISSYQSIVEQGVHSSLNKPSFANICQAASSGDKAAYLTLNRLTNHMGNALASVINISGATCVVIGGQLHLAGGVFLQELKVALRKRVISPLLKSLSLQYASLPLYAGAWGAGVLALEASIKDGSFMARDLTLSKG